MVVHKINYKQYRWNTFLAFTNIFRITPLNLSIFDIFQWRNTKNYPYSMKMHADLGI